MLSLQQGMGLGWVDTAIGLVNCLVGSRMLACPTMYKLPQLD
jgi:hypothetical protein